MKNKQAMKSEIVELLTLKEGLTKSQLGEIYNFINEVDKPKDESLRIPDYIRASSNGAFKGKTYYDSMMQKIVWEEDD